MNSVMGKKNTKTVVLISIVLAVWGVLGYRFVQTLNPPEETHRTADVSMDSISYKKPETASFEIVAKYRDPFLGTLPAPIKTKKTKAPVPKKAPLPKKNIQYLGMLSSKKTTASKGMFFLKIEGKEYVMGVSQKIEGVQLLSGNAKRIRVRYPGHTETVVLNP